MKQKPLLHKLFERDKLFTFSNALSFFRLLGAFYLYHVTVNQQLLAALAVTAVLILSDFADGYFARRLQQVSEMGKVLDPLADKFCAGLGMIALHQAYGLPLWIVILVIGRDVAILLGSGILITRLPYVTPSAMPGKVTVTVLSALFLSYILKIPELQKSLEILTLISIIVSSLHYSYVFFRKYYQKKVVEGKEL